jgi:hypothetical protein
VKSNDKSWRAPAGQDAERIYGSLTFKPFPTTTIRGWYEDVFIDRVSARNTRVGDSVTPWVEAGRPLFDNSFASPMSSPNATTHSVFSRNTVRTNVLIFGATAADVPMMQWGSTGSSVAAGQPVYSVVTKGPGSQPYQIGTDSYNYSLFDTAISPDDVSVNGTGSRNQVNAEIKGFMLEQRVGQKLFLELSHNEEDIVNPNIDMVRGNQMRIVADANMYLPDRVTPNPNVGRYYVEGVGRGRMIRRNTRETRAMASYDLEPAERNKWLGNHRLAAMYQRAHEIVGGQEFTSRHVPAGTPYEEALEIYGNTNQVLGNPTYNTLRYRAYLSDPADSATGTTYYFDMPYNPLEPHTFADGSTVYTTENPYGGVNPGQLSHSLLEGQVFAMQNRFWRDRLVTTFGWRSDRVRSVGNPMPRLGGSTSAFESILTATLPDDSWEYTAGETTTAGAVFHVMPWFSVFYNQSDTWNVPRLNSHNPDNSTLPGSIGEGHDYGIMLRFLDNRVSLRLNKYKSTSGPDNSSFRDDILAPVIAIERTLNEAAQGGLIPAYDAPPGYDPDPPNTFYYELTSDKVSTGYEAELVANPARNWRIAINASKSEATESNIGRVWLDFIGQRMPYWAQYSTVQGPGSATTTLGSRVLDIIQTLNLMRQSDGQATEQARGWRANLVSRYSFSEGRMKGFFIGGGYRWRSKAVIGYRAISVPNDFDFPGVPAEIVVPSVNAPVYGDPFTDVEAFTGYSRRFKWGTWKVQFNIRNLFDDDDIIPQRANTSGDVTIATIPQPRTFILSTTFTY